MKEKPIKVIRKQWKLLRHKTTTRMGDAEVEMPIRYLVQFKRRWWSPWTYVQEHTWGSGWRKLQFHSLFTAREVGRRLGYEIVSFRIVIQITLI